MSLSAFLLAALLIALTPGANNLLGAHHGMTIGAGRSILALGGRLAAFVLLIGAVVAGLGALLASSTWALTVIKWLGVAYLLWLGGRMLVAARTGSTHDELSAAGTGHPVRTEFTVAITNPKAILVFTAFVPQFVDPGAGSTALQLAVLGALYLLAEVVAGTGYVLVGAALRRARPGERTRRRIDGGTGAILVGMAGALAVGRA